MWEVPNSKSQVPNKHQISCSKLLCPALKAWSLEFPWNLELGTWNFASRPNAVRQNNPHAIVPPDALQTALRVPPILFVLRVAVVGFGDLDHLHFVELMHANHPARPHARRARLAAETRRVSAVRNRKLLLRQN